MRLGVPEPSGALNDSLSDIFGQVIERQLLGDKAWKIGEDIFIDANYAFRDMCSPSIYGQPGHMDDYVYTTEDNGGVHINSGIINRSFYEMATRIGEQQTLDLCLYAMKYYFTYTTNFQQAAEILYACSSALYGEWVAQSVADAFALVGIKSAIQSTGRHRGCFGR